MKHFDLTNLFSDKILSDHRFEIELDSIEREVLACEEIRIDFRYFTWIDLWALIQLLFILERANDKELSIYLISPEVIISEVKKRNASAILKFLSEMEFFERVSEANPRCRVLIQNTTAVNKLDVIGNSDIRHLASPYDESFSVSQTDRHIIPITRIETIDIERYRERLYIDSKVVFERFCSETIVKESGIGDCILAELMSNVVEHGGGKGFVALRAVGGLRKLQIRDPQKYKSGKSARVNHSLGDWKEFFSQRYDDGFFELIVADQGSGISSTISESNILDTTREKSNGHGVIDHEWLKFAMRPDTSRLSNSQRREKGLTQFTGLGAIDHVLSSHNGYLMVREKEDRHLFYGTEKHHKVFTTPEVRRRRSSPSREIPEAKPRRFSRLRGTAITAIVPITSSTLDNKSQPLINAVIQKDLLEERAQTVKVFKVVDNNNLIRSYSESFYEKSDWRSIAKKIAALPGEVESILLDLKNVSVDKNRLWSGLSLVKRQCDKQNVAIFLSGVDERTAVRLNDYAVVDKKKISGGEPWVIIGFGDDDQFHLFGRPELDESDLHEIRAIIRGAFNNVTDFALSDRSENLLSGSNYLDWVATDEFGNMMPKLKSDFPTLKALLKRTYQEILEGYIRTKSAWIEDEIVELISGDRVSPYLCIHSVTQIKGIYPDIARLIRIIANEFSFDFVLSVGTAAKSSIARDLSQYKMDKSTDSISDENKILYFSYQDYFSFDHGEDAKAAITPNSRVVLIVDGIRKREHCEEAVDHVQDCGAKVVAIIALIDLDGNLPSDILGIPVRCVLSLPVQIVNHLEPTLREDPYSHKLIKYDKQINPDSWNVFYERPRAFKLAETFGLIQKGHAIFLDRHISRSFVLSFLFNSQSTLSIDLAKHIAGIIANDSIDTIVFPEHSPVGKLVEDVVSEISSKPIEIVVCRQAVYPGKSTSYALNYLGSETLMSSKNVLVIDDQVYSGSSLKNMVSLCRKHSPSLESIDIYVVIESMFKSERRLLEAALQADSQVQIQLFSFMRFPVNRYWGVRSCPICETRESLQKNHFLKHQFLDSQYAKLRLDETEPHFLDYEAQSRKPQTRLDRSITLERQNVEPVVVTTLEGYELFCEVAYVEGDFKWLINGLRPGQVNLFPPEVIISVLELLSHDVSLLFRMRLNRELKECLIQLLRRKELKGTKLSRFLETLGQFPLHFLKDELWGEICETTLMEDSKTFNLVYPGMNFLLQEITRRGSHQLRDRLLVQFDEEADKKLKNLPKNFENKKKEQLILCLKRGYQFEEIPTLSWLISHISQLLVYPIKEGHLSNHQLLYRDLITLSDINDGVISNKFDSTIHCLGHLRYCLEQMKRYFPEQSAAIVTHPDYQFILDQIESLTNVYSEYFRLRKETKLVPKIASDLLGYLFLRQRNGEAQEPFQTTLERTLDRYSKAVREILHPIALLNGKEIEIGSTDILEEKIKVVFDEDAIASVFGEVAKNLQTRRKKTLRNTVATANATGLFNTEGYNLKIVVDLEIDSKTSWVGIEIRNECTQEDIANLEQGGNKGLQQIRVVMEALGYSYQPTTRKIGTKTFFVQNFEMRRL